MGLLEQDKRYLQDHFNWSQAEFGEGLLLEEPEEGQGRIRLIKASTADHLGDAFTKELDPGAFKDAMTAIGMRTMSEDMA